MVIPRVPLVLVLVRVGVEIGAGSVVALGTIYALYFANFLAGPLSTCNKRQPL